MGALQTGDVLSNRWELGPLLGRGAMGEVFRGTDRALQRRVAIKLLAPDLVSDKTMLARFRREALASSRLAHPNVVTTLEFGIHDELPFIVMELMEGEGLDDLVRREQRLDWQRAAALAAQVARGLDAAHRQGIVHRDIKPSNVFIDRRGATETARVMDFGVAQTAAVGPRLTMAGMAVGTPGFVAPEQLTTGQASPRSDIFSLGVTLYEMLTGRLPWVEQEPIALLSAVLRTPPQDLRTLEPAVPPWLASLTMQMIEPVEANRPESCAEVVARLEGTPVDEARHAAAVSTERVVAVASLSRLPADAAKQRDWLSRAIADEGGQIAQSIGSETVCLLPSEEAAVRLSRSEPEDALRPGMALHVGSAELDDYGQVSGQAARVAIKLARVARPNELLVTRALHDSIGWGWRGRTEVRGDLLIDADRKTTVFRVHGPIGDAPVVAAAVEVHPQGMVWRCRCGAHGAMPQGQTGELRIRCSRCSRVLAVRPAARDASLDEILALDEAGEVSSTALSQPKANPHDESGLQSDDELLDSLWTRE